MHVALAVAVLSAAPRLFHDFNHPHDAGPSSLGISAADNALWHALVMDGPTDLPRTPIKGWPAELQLTWAKTWSLYDELLAGAPDVARRELSPVVGEALWQAYLDGKGYASIEQLTVGEKGRDGSVGLTFEIYRPGEEYALASTDSAPANGWQAQAARLIGRRLTNDAGVQQLKDRVVTHGPLPGQAVIFMGSAVELKPLKVPAGCTLPGELAVDVTGVMPDALAARWKASTATPGGRQWCVLKMLTQATGTHHDLVSGTVGWGLVRLQCGEDVSVAGVRRDVGSLEEVTRKLIAQQLDVRCPRAAPPEQPALADALELCKRTGRALPATLTFPDESPFTRNLLTEWAAGVKDASGDLECHVLPEQPLPSPDPKDKSVSVRRVGMQCGVREVWAKIVRKQGKSDVKPMVAALAALWCGLPVWE